MKTGDVFFLNEEQVKSNVFTRIYFYVYNKNSKFNYYTSINNFCITLDEKTANLIFYLESFGPGNKKNKFEKDLKKALSKLAIKYSKIANKKVKNNFYFREP